MELYIETLTGNTFEVKVSPLDTVMSVKNKIQRLEGIPTSQQHLIWHSQELEDDCSLDDYKITDGATLKLVIAMRGGPINTRRVPVEDSTWKEITEYMEASRDEMWDKLPSGQQVTLLVFRDGDQVNLFRLVDRGDGTVAPVAEPRSVSSVRNVCIRDEVGGMDQRLRENYVTMQKMKSIRKQMESLTMKKKQPRKRVICNKLSANVGASTQGKTRMSVNLFRLPPVPGHRVPLVTQASAAATPGALQGKQQQPRKLDATPVMGVASTSKYVPRVVAQHERGTSRPVSAEAPAVEGSQSPVVQLSVQSRGFRRLTDVRAVSQIHGDGRVLRVQTSCSSSSDNEEMDSRWSQASWPASLLESRENLSHSESRSGSAATHDGAVAMGVLSPAPELPARRYLRSNSKQQHAGPHASLDNLEQLQQTLAKFDPRISVQASPRTRTSCNAPGGTSIDNMDFLVRRMTVDKNGATPPPETDHDYYRPRTLPESLTNAKKGPSLNGGVSRAIRPARFGHATPSVTTGSVRTRTYNGARPVGASDRDAFASKAAQPKQSRFPKETEERSTLKEEPRVWPLEATSGSVCRAAADGASDEEMEPVIKHKSPSVVALPSVVLTKKPHRRCQVCNRKTGLATSYSCRCGGNFCASHRYAEMHDCTFDYKAEGRRILEQSNPLVTAQKLPKI